MGCGASTESKNIVYVNGTPAFKADEVTKGFDKENGLLFRMVNRKKKQWAYYNDTTQYEMRIAVTFNEDCDIQALGKTKLERLETGEWVASVTVLPTETELFIEGRVNGFKSKMDAVPIQTEAQEKAEEKPEEKQEERTEDRPEEQEAQETA